jgi:hypothetical protein
MDTCVQQEIRLAGSFGGSVPPIIVASALHAIVPAARSSTFMAIEGRGRLTGRPPKWAADVVDIRFRGASPARHEMILKFTAPRIGEAVPHLYKQRDFWRAPPPEGATSIDLLIEVIKDVSVENRDSDAFDQSVLRDITRFGRVFAEGGDVSVALSSNGPNEPPVQITKRTIDHVRSLTRSTPVPHKVRVVGTLDMIRASTQGFGLKLDDGSEIAGIYEKGEIADLQPLFRQRVSVNGTLVYRPSGRPLRIDATYVRLADAESSVWSRLPAPPHKHLDIHQMHQPQTKRSGIGAIIGHWPGDESDEEIAEKLAMLS